MYIYIWSRPAAGNPPPNGIPPLHTYIHTDLRTYLPTYVCTYVHTYTHKYIHTYIHAYLHTYIQTYIHTCEWGYTHSTVNIPKYIVI